MTAANVESGTVDYDTVGGYKSFRGTCSPLMRFMNDEKQQDLRNVCNYLRNYTM